MQGETLTAAHKAQKKVRCCLLPRRQPDDLAAIMGPLTHVCFPADSSITTPAYPYSDIGVSQAAHKKNGYPKREFQGKLN